ncbi:unnamed protein product [Rhizophagus irregularis]|nr:unnamed protein product [Rhizophagus irregularis]CAB5393968.1 unnamed protein product [Rhizophagus irregularis]
MKKSIKLESLIALIFLGIFVYRRFISPSFKQVQPKHFVSNIFCFVLTFFSSLIKTKPDENEAPNDYLPFSSKYDPRVDYDEFARNGILQIA